MPDDLIQPAYALMPGAAEYLARCGGTLNTETIPGFLRCFATRPDGLVDLSALGLSAEAIEARRNFIGGSDVKILVEDDPAKVMQLWRVKTGRETAEDLSDLFHVHLGSVTEAYSLAWLEKRFKIGVTRHGQRVYHPRHDWAAVTLDGWLENYTRGTRSVQCKHVNSFSRIEEVAARYQPQVQFEAGVSGADGGILAVIIGTNEPVYQDCELDPLYFGQLMEAAEVFMRHVRSDTPPYDLKPVTSAPAKAAKAIRLGEIEMTNNNAWADAADRWLKNKDAAAIFTKAVADVKDLVPKDLARAYGHGIEVVANKAGALSIKALETPPSPEVKE